MRWCASCVTFSAARSFSKSVLVVSFSIAKSVDAKQRHEDDAAAVAASESVWGAVLVETVVVAVVVGTR